MDLGSVIKKARRAKDITQEELADTLGVTLSAVSQWEQRRTLPDIALVPGLCSALDLTADELFGIDPASKEDRIESVIAAVERMEDRGESPKAALALLEDALARYPDSMKLAGQTAFVLGVLSNSAEETPEDRRGFADRSAALYEKILAKSTDEDLRSTAKQALIFHFCDRGDFARAMELAETLPTCYVSREEMQFSICAAMGDVPSFQYYKQFFLSRALEKLTFNCRHGDGTPLYDEDETAALYEKKLAVTEILYDGDFLLSAGAVSFAHAHLAEYRAGRGEYDKALRHLAQSVEAVEALRAYLAPAVIDRHTLTNGDELPAFTCLAFREGRDDTVGGGGRADAENLLARMEKPVFDPIRTRTEFAGAESRLREILN